MHRALHELDCGSTHVPSDQKNAKVIGNLVQPQRTSLLPWLQRWGDHLDAGVARKLQNLGEPGLDPVRTIRIRHRTTRRDSSAGPSSNYQVAQYAEPRAACLGFA